MNNHRNMSVEAFRCCLMYLIVLGHTISFWVYVNGFHWEKLQYWVYIFIGLVIWHVDGFIGISGWYGIRFSFRKFLHLLSIIAFYGMFCAIIRYAFNPVSFSISWLWDRGGWFASQYLVLMLCAPMLNAAVRGIAEKSTKSLLVFWSMMAFAFICSWMPRHFFTGIDAIGFGHHTFLMVAFVYLTARCARCFFIRPISLMWLLSIAVIYFMVILFVSCFIGAKPWLYKLWVLLTYNHSPTVYIVAISLLMIFVWYIKIPSQIEHMVRFISPSMFGVYLFHQTVIRWNGTSDVLNIDFVKNVIGDSCLGIVMLSVMCFAVSIAVDACRRSLAAIIRPYFDGSVNKLDNWFNIKIIQCL